jgi:Tfp pilus assembly protein PilX
MRQSNKNAFALIIAMGLVIFMVLIAFFILEYMVPFSRNTKGIENASRAYYQAESAIENALKNNT